MCLRNANLPNGLLPQELAALPCKCLITGAAIPAALWWRKVTDQGLATCEECRPNADALNDASGHQSRRDQR
jgi:hypothetical protein